VSVIDSGLTKGDKVHFGRAIARTNWSSSGAAEFVIAMVECDSKYEVYLLTNRKSLFAGTFFVDESVLHCSLSFIRLVNGKSQRVVFMFHDRRALESDVEVEITISIWYHILVREVNFIPGEHRASGNVTRSEPSARPRLFVQGKGLSALKSLVTLAI
jgi:hypothetical protein